MKHNYGVCRGRHEMPVEEYFFPEKINPTEPFALCQHARRRLVADGVKPGMDGDLVNVYVTGLTVATVAIIQACILEGIACCLYHYDRETGEYYPQSVNTAGLDPNVTIYREE